MDTQPQPTSPIRALFRSPFRNKNKPLPALPEDQSPGRSPIAEISGNSVLSSSSASPTKGKGSNSFLSKILGSSRTSRNGSTASTTTTKTSDTTSPHRVTISSTTTTRSPSSPADSKSKASRSPIRKHSYFGSLNKKKTSDVRTLSRKVSNLEAELLKARKELDAISGIQRHPHHENEQQEKDKISMEYDRQIEEKALSMSQRGRLDGLVENLLGTAPILQPHQPILASSSPMKAGTIDTATPDSDHNLKRKRSVPDTTAPEVASWEQMQKNIAAFQKHIPTTTTTAAAATTHKRARKSSDSGREAAEDTTTTSAAEEKARKRAHRDQPVDPIAFARLVRQQEEKEAQQRLREAEQEEEAQQQQEKDAASSLLALSDLTSRPQSRRQTGRQQMTDFSSFGKSMPSTTTTTSRSATSHLLQSWPAPHSLSPSTHDHDHGNEDDDDDLDPASTLPPALCTPHLPPSLHLQPDTEAYELHSSSTSSIASDNSSPRSDADIEHRRALTEQWRLMQEDEEAADAEMRELEEQDEEGEELEEEEEDELGGLDARTKPPVKRGRLVPRPTRLSRVVEEFEWDDGETF